MVHNGLPQLLDLKESLCLPAINRIAGIFTLSTLSALSEAHPLLILLPLQPASREIPASGAGIRRVASKQPDRWPQERLLGKQRPARAAGLAVKGPQSGQINSLEDQRLRLSGQLHFEVGTFRCIDVVPGTEIGDGDVVVVPGRDVGDLPAIV